MTTLDDATCYGLFFPPGKSLISEAEKIRWSMGVIKALYQQGLFSNLTISPTEPGDQTKLWLDESTDPDTLKVYSTGQWRSVASVGGDEAFKKLFPSALLTLAPGFVTTSMIATNAVTYAKMQQVAASSLVGNPTGALANAQGITLGATLAFSGSALQTAAITGDVTASANSFATTLATNVVSNAKFRQSAALSVVGNSTGSTANVADIAGIADQVLRVNGAGTALAFGAIDLSKTAAATGVLQAASFPAMTGDVTTVAGALASTIAANAVTNAKFRQGAGLSVVGVTGGSTANVADIAGTANQVLRLNSAGTALAFGSINLASSAAVTGTLAAVNGGTGLASFAVGDLLQANTTTTLAALAAVATGNALISGGVGVVSAWGKIGLTTHISGTLAVGNGGTGATTLTAHGVLIGNGTGAIVAAAVGATGTVLAGSTGADPSFITLSAAIDTISANWGDILFRGTSGWIALAAGSSGKYLQTNGVGADPTWAAVAGAGGTVSSVAVSGGTTGLSTSGGPITTTGTITLAGTLIAANGGTGFASYAVGDVLYADTTTTLAKLAKNASASRYLSNSGASNIPAWAQVDLTNGVVNALPIANGGTNGTTALAGFDNIKQSSTASYQGVVELATNAETTTGTDTVRAITPANLRAVYPWIRITKASDETIVSDAVMSDDSDLKFAVAANTKYRYRMEVIIFTDAVADFKNQINGPASPTMCVYSRNGAQNAMGYSTSTDATFAQSNGMSLTVTGYLTFFCEGILINGVNAGTVSFQWAQNTSNAGNTTVKAGSFLEYYAF